MLKKYLEKLLLFLGGKVSYKKRVNINHVFLKKYKKIELLGCRFSFSYPPRMGKMNKVLLTQGDVIIKELDENETIPGCDIQILGDNNIVMLDADTIFRSCCIRIRGNNNKVIIENSLNVIRCVNINMAKYGNNRLAHIKKNFYSAGTVTLAYGVDDNISIIIGNDCMSSVGIYVMSTDGHPIYDLNSKERLNHDKNVYIGDKVWIGAEVRILKGVTIPSNCIIGMNSVVTKSFNINNSILAGNPARIIKEHIIWNRLFPIQLQVEAFGPDRELERERERTFRPTIIMEAA